MYSIASNEIKKLQPEWFSWYEQQGIDMFSINRSEFYRWDKVVLSYFDEFGTAKFRQEAIWDVDWVEIAKKVNQKISGINLSDPRNRTEKLIHNWLKKTQPYSSNLIIKFMDLSLRIFGW
jgi:hypothetical protein